MERELLYEENRQEPFLKDMQRMKTTAVSSYSVPYHVMVLFV